MRRLQIVATHMERASARPSKLLVVAVCFLIFAISFLVFMLLLSPAHGGSRAGEELKYKRFFSTIFVGAKCVKLGEPPPFITVTPEPTWTLAPVTAIPYELQDKTKPRDSGNPQSARRGEGLGDECDGYIKADR